MKSQLEKRTTLISGELDSMSFGMSQRPEDVAHMVTILRDRMYNNKILAVLREYSCNAVDAHIDAGIPDKPIEVTLPTSLESSLIIRDFGPGLSPDAIREVYVMYGRSLKRDSDAPIGTFGIGAKSGFAYTDSFSVTSWHGGYKRTYFAVIDESNIGKMSLVYEASCDPDETGIAIKVPVDPRDIQRFYSEARYLLNWFQPHPVIKNNEIELGDPRKTGKVYKAGVLRPRLTGGQGQRHLAIMGNVPYAIDLDRVYDLDEDADEAEKDYINKLKNNPFALFFDMGEVMVGPGRESLEYTQKTRDAVKAKISALLNEASQSLIDSVSTRPNNWLRRHAVREYMTQTGLPVPSEYAKLAQPAVKIPKGKGFKLYSVRMSYRGRGGSSGLKVELNRVESALLHNMRLGIYRKYDDRDPSGYIRDTNLAGDLGSFLVMKPTGVKVDEDAQRVPCTREESLKNFEQWLKDNLLDGVRIRQLEDFGYTSQSAAQDSRLAKKHRKHQFILKPKTSRWGSEKPYSQYWAVAEEDIPAEHVAVIISHFAPKSEKHWALSLDSIWGVQNTMKGALGIEVPPIVGYKTTAKKPIDYDDLKEDGILSVERWLRQTLQEELNDDMRYALLVQAYAYSDLTGIWEFIKAGAKNGLLQKHLPSEHALLKAYRVWDECNRVKRSLTSKQRYLLAGLYNLYQDARVLPQNLKLPDFQHEYPMLATFSKFSFRKEGYLMRYIDYVKMTDVKNEVTDLNRATYAQEQKP